MQRRRTRAQLAAGALAAWTLCCGRREQTECAPRDPEREAICIEARSGGQTGMEGSCLPRPEPEPLSAEDVRRLLTGKHATTLAYRPRYGAAFDAPPASLPLTVTVALRGEARLVDARGEHCQPRILQDVELTLSLDEPALELRIDTTAHAFASDLAVVQLELPESAAQGVGLPSTSATLSLAFDARGVRGTLDPNAGCGFAVLPSDAHCADWSRVEVDLDRERDGFRPRDALSALEALGEVPLRFWDGDETTLSLSIVQAPQWACSDEWNLTFCPIHLELPLTIRATTEDGSLDAELPAALELSVSTEASASEGTCGSRRAAGELEELSLQVTRVRMPAGTLGAAVWRPERGEVGLSLQLWRGPDGPHAEAQVFAIELEAPELNGPLGATLDPTTRCVVAKDTARPDPVR